MIMAKHSVKSSIETAPENYVIGPRVRKWPVTAILATVALVGYVAGVHFVFRAPQPALWQRLLGLGCALLALLAYLFITRRKEWHDEMRRRARIAQLSDFGKQQVEAWRAKQRHTVKLPWLGETSIRLLGGLAVFGLTAVWWLTPLAPVRVKKEVIDDLTIPLGEEIAAAVLIVPDGRIALVAPPIVPPRARELARLIKEDASPYLRGLKATAEGRHETARFTLNIALNEGETDPVQVQFAIAQNELYAGMSTDAANIFENVLHQRPDNAMVMLQAAIAWLHAGVAENAEPLVARAMKACQGKSAEKVRGMTYCLHAQTVLRVIQGKQFGEAEAFCLQTRDLIEAAEEASLSLLAASLNNEAALYLLVGKYPGAINRFEEARYNWTKAFGPIHPLVAANLGNQAGVYVILGSFREAEEALSRAEGISNAFLPMDHPLMAHTRTARALFHEALGQYVAGLARAEEALAIVEKALGSTHPANVPVLDTLALLYADQARYYKAKTLCRRATNLGRLAWGPQHPFFAQTLIRRAQLDIWQKQYSEAETSCRRAFDILGQSFVKGHPETATVLNTWGRLEIERQHSDDARTYLDKALKIRETVFGKEHPDVARTLGNLAALENSLHAFDKSAACYKRAITISESSLGAKHPEVARLLYGQAILFQEEKKFPEAAADLDRALTIQKNTLTPFHPELAATLESYASLLRAIIPPDTERAAKMKSQAESVREKHEQVDRPE